MKLTHLKNIFLVWSGIAIATSTAILAAPLQWMSIQANLINLVQYLKELQVTTDGTPNGEAVLSINGSGQFGQQRMWVTNGNMYAIMNWPEGMWPNTEAVWFGAFSGEHISNINGIVNMFGFNQSLMSYSDDEQGIDSYMTVSPQGSIMAFSGYGQERAVVVNSNGVGFYFNGSGYTFPSTVGLPNQVLTTNGSNELSWTSIGQWSSSHQTELVWTYDFNDFNTQEGDPNIIFTGQLPVGSIPVYFVVKTNQAFVSDSSDEVSSAILFYNDHPMSSATSVSQWETNLSPMDPYRIYPTIDQPLDFEVRFSHSNGWANPQDRAAWQVQVYIVYDSIQLP